MCSGHNGEARDDIGLGTGREGTRKEKGSIVSTESGGRDDRRWVAGIISESMDEQWKDGKAMGRIRNIETRCGQRKGELRVREEGMDWWYVRRGGMDWNGLRMLFKLSCS